MKLPSEPERKNNVLDLIAGEFYAKSKGHPLYLHYSIKSILERGLELNSSNIKGLPDLPQDLSEYYSAVQTGLPELAIQILHLFSITPFVWTQEGILECLEPIIPDSSRVVESIRNISYLLKKEGNTLTIFHNSLMEFLLTHSEHVTYSNRLRPLLLKWLEEKASDYLRESYLWLINAEGGNEDPLVDGPTRDWVVNSISKPLLGVSEILTRSAICALKKGKLDRFVTITFLRNYYDYAKDFRSYEFDNLFYTQLNVNNDPYFLESSISFLIDKTNKQLRFIAEMNVENQPLVKKCLDELTERLRGNRFSLYEEDISTAFVSFLQVAAICDDLDLQDLVDKLLDERFQNNKPHPISVLSNSMRVYNRAGPILNLLKANLPAEIFYIVLKDAILLSFEEGFDLTQEVLKNRSNPFAAIYGYLLNLPNFSIDSITFPSFSLHSMRESEKYFKKNEIMQTFYNIFFAFLSNHLWDKEEENSNWIATTPLDMWPTNLVEEMNDATKELAQLIKSKGEFHLDWLYDKFSSIRRPTWPEGRNDIIYGECAETTLNKSALDIFIIFSKIGKNHNIEIEELEKAFLSSYCSPWNWLEEYTSRRRRLLSDDCLTFVGSSLEAEVKSSIELFSDRAKKYNQLAKLFTIHDSKDEARTYLSKVAENLLTYGDHKDVLLFGIFDIMEACYDVNIPEAKNWLKKIIPAITYVNQYTDGDETNHLPSELGEFLAKYEPKMATNYYRWLQNEEQYHYALDTFNSFLKYADLENPVVESIAKTAVDNESILILSKRKSEGTKGAGNVLSAIEKLLGEGAIEKITQKQGDNKRNDETLFRARKELPNPSEYPPERFEDYLTDAEEIGYFSNSVERWIAYWRNTSHKEQAYSSILQAIKKGTTLRGYDSLFDFSLSLRGRQEAYQWLVKANIEEYGWNLYWTRKEKAINRWNIVKNIYPDKWFDFIIDSLEPLIKKRWGYSTDSFVRLVEYCFYMEKPELAKKIANQAVDSTLELVSPLELPEPEWLEDE